MLDPKQIITPAEQTSALRYITNRQSRLAIEFLSTRVAAVFPGLQVGASEFQLGGVSLFVAALCCDHN